MTDKTITEKLMEPFPKEALKQREADRGKAMLTYVDGTTVFRRLIHATGNNFSVEVLDQEFKDFGTTRSGSNRILLIARVRLTIPGMGSREHVGVQVVNADSGGEDLWKGAVTDAIKKAATLFGVGLELYGPDYEELVRPLNDGEFAKLANEAGADPAIWKRLTDAAGDNMDRWTLLFEKAPNDTFRKRLDQLAPKPPTQAALA